MATKNEYLIRNLFTLQKLFFFLIRTFRFHHVNGKTFNPHEFFSAFKMSDRYAKMRSNREKCDPLGKNTFCVLS